VKVLVTGATGFIGSAVVASLAAEGVDIIAVSRRALGPSSSSDRVQWVRVDMARAADPADWTSHLVGVDAVVNCAGVLQDSPRDSTAGVHHRGAAALFEACERAGIRRVVQISAVGADQGDPSAFSASKRAGDKALATRDVDWVILRPSVVVGRGAYGGSALFRALAAWPILPMAPDAGRIQIVQLDAVVQTIVRFLSPESPGRVILELVGPEQLSFEQVIAAYRKWLGWPPARLIRVPAVVMGLAYAAGDAISWLGWRSPIRSTARHELARSTVGDPAPWRELIGIEPLTLDAGLQREPASVQEHWFARLYLLKPLILSAFAVFWIATGLVTLGPGYAAAVDILRRCGLGELAAAGAVAGAFTDIAIGLAIAWRRTARAGLWAALGISVFYVVGATIMLPSLWTDPLGALVKILPIAVLNLVALAILDDR
jgi:uncharacterized protein YbjT (DUF2867 family)